MVLPGSLTISLSLSQVCGGDKPYMGPEVLDREHAQIKDRAMDLFHSARKMGGSEFSRTYAEKLEEEIMELYASFVKHNESKNIFAAARTPAVLFAIMVVCYMVAGLLGVVGLESLANLLNLIMGVALVLLSVWAYVRYSGEHRELGMHIDNLAEIIWEQVGPVLKEQARSVADHHLRRRLMDQRSKFHLKKKKL